MKDTRYRPRYESRRAKSATITVPGAAGDEPLTLTCRWPDDEMPKAFAVFCHGLGNSGRDYAELSSYWAAHGYLVIHPTFSDWIGAVAANEPELGLDPTDDISGWTAMPRVAARLHEILHTPSHWLERIRIVRQLPDALGAIYASTCGQPAQPIPGAITGHSFGAYTSQLIAGAEIDVPGRGASRFRDERFKTAVLLSAQGRDQQGLREGSWDGMRCPVLNVTGTLDRGAKGQDWKWKCEPYGFAPPGGKYLAVLDGADHYLGGLTARTAKAGSPDQRDAVFQLTLAFLDGYVTGDEAARTWLASIADRIGNASLLFQRK